MRNTGMIKWSTETKANRLSTATFVSFPLDPSSYGDKDLQVVTNSNRTVGAKGKLLKEFLAMKETKALTWNYMTPAQYASLRAIFRNRNFFSIEVPDEDNPGQRKRLVVYGGDITAKAVRYDPLGGSHGMITGWKDVSWELIEQ